MIGQIQEFDPEKEKVTAYLERVQMFFGGEQESACALVGDRWKDLCLTQPSVGTG